jgi:hypothetical protein
VSGDSSVPPLRGHEREQVAAALAQRFVHEHVTIHELAREVGRRPSLVRRLLNEAGVCAENSPCVGVGESEVTATLARRYRSGVSIERLSEETGIDRRAVRRLLCDAGVSPPECG